MDGLNKFKVLTIIFLCMFVFIIAAIYTNTKEVTENKTQLNHKISNEQIKDKIISGENIISQDNSQLQDLSLKVEQLSRRIDEIANSRNSDGTNLNCRVQGVMDGDRVEQLSQEAAMQEAKVNNKELVMTCSF